MNLSASRGSSSSLLLGASIALVVACGGDAARSVTVTVRAAEGATINAPTGIVVEIPPHALAQDTAITVTAFDEADVAVAPDATPFNLHLGAAVLDPDGTKLAAPARVSFPLPADWSGEPPVIYESPGSNPALTFPGDRPVAVSGSGGALRAVFEVDHFSTYAPSRNCHGGTIRRLLAAFKTRRCSPEQLLNDAAARFKSVKIDESNAVYSTGPSVQAFLDTHFDESGSFSGGQEVSASTLAELSAHVLAGRQVVLAFTTGETWPTRNAAGFYEPFSHSCVLEPDGKGGMQMHHTVVRPPLNRPGGEVIQRLADAHGGELDYVYPLDRLNEYRTKKTGEALEEALGLQAQGLSPYGPLEQRKVAYPSMHVYVEKPGVALSAACSGGTSAVSFPDPTGDWTITLGLPSGTTAVADVLADTAAYNDEWVKVTVPDLPADPAAWEPMLVSIKVSGGTYDRLRLYSASNNWDPASRSNSYQDFASGDSLTLGGERYYWLYVYTSDPKFVYDYTMQIFRLVGAK